MNSAKHGLTGSFMVLGSERVDDYRARVDEWLASLDSRTAAERLVVLLLADLSWRLERLHRLEHQHHLSVLETEMKKTRAFATHTAAQQALIAINELVRTVAGTSTPPTTEEGVEAFMSPCRAVLGLVKEVEGVQLRSVRAFEHSLAALADSSSVVAIREAFYAVGKAGEALAAELGPPVNESRANLKKVEKILADTMLLIDDVEGRKLARYRDQLQKAMAQQLDILDGVRRRSRGGRKEKGSFGKAFPGVTLRVVK